jgi:hypothetical protein
MDENTEEVFEEIQTLIDDVESDTANVSRADYMEFLKELRDDIKARITALAADATEEDEDEEESDEEDEEDEP